MTAKSRSKNAAATRLADFGIRRVRRHVAARCIRLLLRNCIQSGFYITIVASCPGDSVETELAAWTP